ncbi:MAG: hypothetical protein AAF456_10560 [Planctomycetota bacterium]
MKRFKGLLRDTWWLWIGMFVLGIVTGRLISPAFYSAIPISIFSFFYFALMRYDENGNHKEGM